jgi:hypothetical protein
MNQSQRFAGIAAVASVLAVAIVPLLTPAWGHLSLLGATPGAAWAMTEVPGDVAKRGDRLVAETGPPQHCDPMSRCGGGPSFGAGSRLPEGPPPHAFGAGHLAARLGAAETEIGIRANQLDAWRDFTDALLGAMAPPSPPPAATVSGTPPGQHQSEPFERARRIANNAIARGHHGEDLLKAIQNLTDKLTPEQLAKVAELEARLQSPRQAFGTTYGRRDGFGPDAGSRGPVEDQRPPLH